MKNPFGSFFKSDDDARLAKGEKIIARLEASSYVQELDRQDEEECLFKKNELLSQLKLLREAESRSLPVLVAAVDAAERADKLAQEAQKVTSRARADAEHDRLCFSLDSSFKRSVIEAEIRKLAPPEIDDFIRAAMNLDDATRREIKAEQRPGPRSRITGQVSSSIFVSNSAAVQAQRAYLKSAIAEAEAMKSMALSLDEIVKRLEELKSNIPDGYRFETLTIPRTDVSELRRAS